MLSPLRNRFGIPGVISVMALLFAMLGGAYAASSDNGGKATASAKAKRGPRGPKGATGPAGPAGPVGPVGPAGAKGDAGANGAPGAPGAAGTPGKGVLTTSFTGLNEPTGEPCGEQGGASVEVEGSPASKKYVCNGAAGSPGSQGIPGDPWTAGGTLPVGKTETGAYAVTGNDVDIFGVWTAISFNVPLKNPLDAAHVHYVTPVNPNANCTGTPNAPTAASGHLCIYLGVGTELSESPIIAIPAGTDPGAGTSGALLKFPASGEQSGYAAGGWAVTG